MLREQYSLSEQLGGKMAIFVSAEKGLYQKGMAFNGSYTVSKS